MFEQRDYLVKAAPSVVIRRIISEALGSPTNLPDFPLALSMRSPPRSPIFSVSFFMRESCGNPRFLPRGREAFP